MPGGTVGASAGRADLEVALAAATGASLPLDPHERPAFIRSHLLSQADNTPPPVASGKQRSGTPELLQSELASLAKYLTDVVNASRDKPGWPLRAVATTLETHPFPGMPVKDAAAPIADGSPTVVPEEEPAAGEKKKVFRVSTNGMIRRMTFREHVPAAVLQKRDSNIASETTEHVLEVARIAFEMFDVDNSGTIDKEELFQALLELGRVAPMMHGSAETKKVRGQADGRPVAGRQEVGGEHRRDSECVS